MTRSPTHSVGHHTTPWTLAIILLVTLAAYASAEVVDLSYVYNVNAPTYPAVKPFAMKVQQKGFIADGVWLEMNEFCTSEHSGTHIDAPVHFAQGSWYVDEIPLDRFWNIPGVVVDVTQAVLRSATKNYAIQVKDMEKWESKHGIIPDGAIVIFRTGWGEKVNNTKEYSGLDENNNINFPGLSSEAASWLAAYGDRRGYQKGVVAVGVDTFSLDVGNATVFPAHVTLFKRNIYGVENMANLEKLPAKGFTITVLPLRIRGGSGSPARVIASV